METVGSVTISDLMRSEVEAYKRSGRKVVLCLAGEETWGICTNCNDTGLIFATVILSGPYISPPIGKHCTHMKAGWFEVKDVGYDCPICVESGYRPDVIVTMLRDSGLEQEELDWRLNYIKGVAGKEIAFSEANLMLSTSPTPNGLLLLFGDYGVGKSGILKSMTSAFIRTGIKSRYIRASDILSQIRSSYDNSSLSESTIISSMQRYGFLAIDEIDRIPDTEWATSTLFAILDKRYDARSRCATAMATNMMPDDMVGHWEYLSSRLMDGRRVPVGGISFRGAQQSQLNIGGT